MVKSTLLHRTWQRASGSKQTVSNSRDTKVLIKATRIHSSIFENQPHLHVNRARELI